MIEPGAADRPVLDLRAEGEREVIADVLAGVLVEVEHRVPDDLDLLPGGERVHVEALLRGGAAREGRRCDQA